MRKLLVPVMALALGGVACLATDADEGLLHAVTTVAPITNLVHNVGGEHIRVSGLVPQGVDSHTFEPRPGDARVLAEADVVFVNGLNLELPTIQLAEANIPSGTQIVTLGESTIAPDEYVFDFSFPLAEGDPNPHLWTHPPFAKRYAELIADVLADLDPANAVDYRANAEELGRRFDALSAALHEATATVPEGNRKLLTYHDSFPYVDEYGWTVIGAIEPSNFSEPGPREVARLIRQIRDEGVPAIFGSEVFPSPVLEQIARESGVEYVDDLRDDDLPGSPGDPTHSLLELLVFDYVTIVEALGGDASALRTIDTTNLGPGANVAYR